MFTLDNVKRAYTGKPGCMCGCMGKYSTPALNPRSVKILFNKVMKNPARIECPEDGWAYVETATRNLVIYFKD